jgi:hypothetical protein
MKSKLIFTVLGGFVMPFIYAQEPIFRGGIENRSQHFQDSLIIEVHLDAPYIIYAESQGSYITSESLSLFLSINEDTTTSAYSPLNSNITVFPNPTYEQVILQRNDPAGNWQIYIYDENGRMVREVEWPDGVSSIQIHVQLLTPGMYVISLMDEKGISTNQYKLLKL